MTAEETRIMNKTGRNDPCHCGSGQKYKKCCLAKDNRDRRFESRRSDEEQAVQRALSWLTETYPDETAQAFFEGFFGGMAEENLACIDDLPPGVQDMLGINSGEWMLADGDMIIDGKAKRVNDLVLGPGGPLMPARGREWIKALGEFHMSLYEVRDVKPGEGVRVADLLAPDAEPVWVWERTASKKLVRWDMLGARLARQDKEWVFTGAIYPFAREEGIGCRDEILDILESDKTSGVDRRMLVSTTIIDTWLERLLAPEEMPLPNMMDAATGERILLTTDHYRVTDWKELERILDAQEDVQGNRDGGWSRLVEKEDGVYRSLASILAKEPDGMEVFCRTERMADDARQWLENIAGSVVAYKIREVVDPRSPKALEEFKRKQKPGNTEPGIPQDVQRRIIHQHLVQHYEKWPEMPLPALGMKTPLEAVNDERLRSAVIELLKGIDLLEARRIGQTGGEPLDVTFLWERLGVTR